MTDAPIDIDATLDRVEQKLLARNDARAVSPSPDLTIQIAGPCDGPWEFAVWRGETQLVLGHRATQAEAYAAAVSAAEGEDG